MCKAAERGISGLARSKTGRALFGSIQADCGARNPPPTTRKAFGLCAIRACAMARTASRAIRFEPLGEHAEFRYPVPHSGPLSLTHVGIPLDEVEDLLLESAAYRQASR